MKNNKINLDIILSEYAKLKPLTLDNVGKLLNKHIENLPAGKINGLAVSFNSYYNAYQRVSEFNPMTLPLTEKHPEQRCWTPEKIEEIKTKYEADLEKEQKKFIDELQCCF